MRSARFGFREEPILRTPWGIADHVTVLDHGIRCVSTPSHGGYYVPPEARKLMPPEALNTYAGPGWYEEDCDWALVALSFPKLFPEDARALAEIIVRKWHSPEVCKAYGLTPAADSHYRARA